jgi:aminoglycoside phosphotransferase (APT) family kinase protein
VAVAGDDAGLAAGLEALLADRGVVGTVDGLVRLSGGASRHTYRFDLVAPDGRRRPLILQRSRSGTFRGGPGMGGEAVLLRAAAAGGVPVPEVVADDDGTFVAAPAIVSERLEGETIARKLLRDEAWAAARPRLVQQAGAALAAIHRLPAEGAPLHDVDQLEELGNLLRSFDVAVPAFELALRWLRDNRPPGRPHSIVHGDFRLGNLLVGPDGLRGVLDWELAHVGDPVEDLGWYCVRAWRFGSALPAGGTGTREQLLAAYRAAGGAEVDLDELRWWELLGTLRWGLICMVQADAHLSGMARSVELAAIGRRASENEWDVLGLLPGGPLPTEPPPPAAPEPALYGRPTAAQLLEAVREWVDGDVRGATEGRLAYHARVAANALRMVEREVTLGPAHRAAHAAGLARLGCADDEELAARIRSGALDDRAEEVRAVVAVTVRGKLEVANPRWLEPDG